MRYIKKICRSAIRIVCCSVFGILFSFEFSIRLIHFICSTPLIYRVLQWLFGSVCHHNANTPHSVCDPKIVTKIKTLFLRKIIIKNATKTTHTQYLNPILLVCLFVFICWFLHTNRTIKKWKTINKHLHLQRERDFFPCWLKNSLNFYNLICNAATINIFCK